VSDLPLHGTTVVVVGSESPALPYAARLLRDFGADVMYLPSAESDTLPHRALLTREPAIAVVSTVPDQPVSAVVRMGAVPAAHAPALESLFTGGANEVLLSWCTEDEPSGADVLVQAEAGVAHVVGERDRPPLAFPHRIGDYVLGVNAAALVSLLEISGRRGCRAAVSSADVWAYAIGTNWFLCVPKGIPYVREGRRSPGNGGVYPQRLFEAKDGLVTLLCRSSRDWQNFLTAVGRPAWAEDPRYQDVVAMGILYPDEVDKLVEAETARYTRDELFALAREHGFPLASVRTPGEAMQDEYLGRQGFWAEAGGLRMPGSLCRPETWQPANEVDAGTSRTPLVQSASGPARSLQGLRVLDLSWVWAGPMVGSILADLGAEVVKVEHEARLDNMRLRGRLGGVPDGIDGREIDPLFHNVNRGKKSMLLDMKSEAGRDVFLNLVRNSDVVLESFRPHVLESWGIGYDELQQANPAIVLLSLRGLELDPKFGPSGLRSYAPITSSLSGMESQVAYPGEAPTGAMGLGISDPVAGWHGAMLVLAALVRRMRSGKGGWIRLSQLETLGSSLTEMYLAAQTDNPVAADVVSFRDGDDDYFEAAAGGGRMRSRVRPVEDHPAWSERFGRDVLYSVIHPVSGEEKLYSHGWRIDGDPLPPLTSAPIIGADTDQLLVDVLGLDAAAIAKLRSSGALR
jgi:crotonobetainyl-CoA:carnitine CoA-transferase CaiB-like acyl-CoA transferase